MTIKFNAPWHQLKHAWVGTSYHPDFYGPIKNSAIRESLQKIAQETEQDYQNLIGVLKSFSIKVERPEIDPDLTILDYVNNEGQLDYVAANSCTLIPRPPMQPRDSVLIVGNTMIEANDELQWLEPLIQDLDISNIIRNSNKKFDAPLVTVIGNHLIVDCREHAWLGEYIQSVCPDRKVVPVMIGGHNDAVFCPVSPGLIVSTYHHSNYSDTFPGWEVKYIENQSWDAIPDWRKFKHSNSTKWWVPDADKNPEFEKFVDTWLSHWLGYVEETVFDVNMLQINSNTVLVNNYNKELFSWFASKKIEPIVVPFRHRFFWDGGIHCITADLYREGDTDDFIRF
jgi:hypothetical protein